MGQVASKNLAIFCVAAASSLFSFYASAGAILANNGIVSIEASPSSLNTTPVADPGGNPVGSINYGAGQILLKDYANNPLTTHTPNPSWWKAPGVAYTTTTRGIEISFANLQVTGFTFNIGANQSSQAWIRAYYHDGAGQAHTLTTGWFGGISARKTPSYGVYVSQPTSSCAVITKIEIDPPFVWGVGNFGIAESACQNVPEPQTNSLLGLGFLAIALNRAGLLSTRRRVRVISNR